MIISRAIESQLMKLMKRFPVVSVSGPRQSGKTTLLRSMFPDRSYVNLENLDFRAMVQEDIRGFLRRYSDSGIIIDEAQRVPELFSYLQQFADESRDMGKYILSGSQNFLLLENITQSLAGRVGLVSLFPFTLKELQNTKIYFDSVNEYIYSGMYPALYDRDIPPEEYYPSYLQTYVERDVRNLKNIGDLNTFRRFLQLCAGRIGQILNYSSLGNDLGVNHKTVKTWISVLEASYIVFLLQPHFANLGKRVIKQPKLYFYDTGLVCSLLGIKKSDQIADHYLRGGLFENFVIAEYIKMTAHRGGTNNAWFFRDQTGNEVDLIIDDNTKIRPVEIKAGETLSNEFFKGLKKYQELQGKAAGQSYLVYGGRETMQRKAAVVLSWKDIPQLS